MYDPQARHILLHKKNWMCVMIFHFLLYYFILMVPSRTHGRNSQKLAANRFLYIFHVFPRKTGIKVHEIISFLDYALLDYTVGRHTSRLKWCVCKVR